ncbi:hypothetical protein CEQ90_11810 [Lewinellaceae bacterium SD302]|nr:hypothetical protein CEQ90_11810 [Lewinellaceae bacterium SD302]
MQTFKKILVPVDFSEIAANAFIYALRMADKIGAEVQLLHCVHPGMAIAEVPAYASDITGKLLDVGRESMTSFVKRGVASVSEDLAHEPKIKELVEIGEAVSTTKFVAEDDDFDLVVMGTRGAFGTWAELFGSHASGTLVNAPCPVLVVPEGARFDGIEKLCFATDLEGVDALVGPSLVASLAPMSPDIHFVHVREKNNLTTLDFATLKSFYAEREVPFKITVSEPSASGVADAILEEAIKNNADIIVMSRPGYSFFDTIFHKSRTREVALHSPLPLLVLNEAPLG